MTDPDMSWTQLGGALGAVGTVAASIWAWLERSQRTHAEVGADVARENAERSIYTMMTDRLSALEKDVAKLRDELSQERSHSRALERHIWKLERLMRQGGLEPPAFEDPLHAVPVAKP